MVTWGDIEDIEDIEDIANLVECRAMSMVGTVCPCLEGGGGSIQNLTVDDSFEGGASSPNIKVGAKFV